MENFHKVALLKLLALQELEELEIIEKRRRLHRFWVNPFLAKRELHCLEHFLLKDLLWDDKEFSNFTRINFEQFQDILQMITPFIEKKNTTFRSSISPCVRLAITLRFIATGDSYRSLEFLSHVSRKTISKFIPEVLEALNVCL